MAQKNTQTLEEMIASLQQRDHETLDGKGHRIDKEYENVDFLIKKVSELTGIPPRRLLRVAVQTAFSYEGLGLNWRYVLGVLRSVYAINNSEALSDEEGEQTR